MHGLREVKHRHAVLIVTVTCLLLSGCSQTEQPGQICDAGRRAATSGGSTEAIETWEKKALDTTPKEKLRAVMTCLRDSGLATSDVDAAGWIVRVADKSHGRASLYAGMLYASGAGLPADRGVARKYLEEARSAAPDDAAAMLRVLDTVEGAASK